MAPALCGQLCYSFKYESKKGEGIVTRPVGGGKHVRSNVSALSENKSLCSSLGTIMLFLTGTAIHCALFNFHGHGQLLRFDVLCSSTIYIARIQYEGRWFDPSWCQWIFH